VGARSGEANARVEQQIIFCTEGQKPEKLAEALRDAEPPVIVFCNTREVCETVASICSDEGYSAVVLHGGKMQEQRMANLKAFKERAVQILVATDVAGRGIDVTGVTLVVNYEMPQEIDKYRHRIGRTGRAGKTGRAVSLLTTHDTEIMFDLKESLEASGQEVPRELAHHPAAQSKEAGMQKITR
jgi:ATP-dependent RNA helicase DDX23/PRP28